MALALLLPPLAFVPDAALCSATTACVGLKGLCCPTAEGIMLDCCADLRTAMGGELSLPSSLNTTDWCGYSLASSLFLDSLTLSAAEAVLKNVTSREFFAGGVLNVAVGSALLLAPVMLGPSWPTYLIFVLSFMLGAILANKFLVAWLTSANGARCASGLLMTTAIAVGLGFFSLSAANYAFFALGAAMGGFGAHHVSGLIVPMLSEEHAIQVEQQYVQVAVVVAAILSGWYLSSAKVRGMRATGGGGGALHVQDASRPPVWWRRRLLNPPCTTGCTDRHCSRRSRCDLVR